MLQEKALLASTDQRCRSQDAVRLTKAFSGEMRPREAAAEGGKCEAFQGGLCLLSRVPALARSCTNGLELFWLPFPQGIRHNEIMCVEIMCQKCISVLGNC